MPDNIDTLWCYVEEDDSPIAVTPSLSISIKGLRDMITGNYAAGDLTMWKVRSLWRLVLTLRVTPL
jgi:hypothetical protein